MKIIREPPTFELKFAGDGCALRIVVYPASVLISSTYAPSLVLWHRDHAGAQAKMLALHDEDSRAIAGIAHYTILREAAEHAIWRIVWKYLITAHVSWPSGAWFAANFPKSRAWYEKRCADMPDLIKGPPEPDMTCSIPSSKT